MSDNKKSFGEIWSELTDEQAEYLKDYINKQKENAVEHHLKNSERNLMVLENFILHITHCSEGDWEANKAIINTANELYQMAKDYIEEDHVDGELTQKTEHDRINHLELRSDFENENIETTDRFIARGFIGNKISKDDNWVIDVETQDGDLFNSYLYVSEFEYEQDLKTLKL